MYPTTSAVAVFNTVHQAGGDAMTIPDYIAVGALIMLVLWAAARLLRNANSDFRTNLNDHT